MARPSSVPLACMLAAALLGGARPAAAVVACTAGDTCIAGPNPAFAAHQDYATPLTFAHFIGAGDLDGDGKPDVVVPNFSPQGFGYTSVFRNTGTPGTIAFAPRVDLGDNWNVHSVAIADLDGDGRRDLAIGNASEATAYGISLWRNTGSIGVISFAARQNVLAANAPIDVAAGDLDGDGRADLVCANYYSYPVTADPGVSVFRNTGSPGTIALAGRQDFNVGDAANSVALADVDGDGRLDVIVTISGTAIGVSVLRNTSSVGAISFAPWTGVTFATYPTDVTAGDLDGDGRPDLVVSMNNGSKLTVFPNASTPGTVSLLAGFDVPVGATPCQVALADVDCDGRADLVNASYGGNAVRVTRNLSSPGVLNPGTFAPVAGFAVGTHCYGVTAADLDGDGKPDLAGMLQTDLVLAALRNSVQLACGSICGAKFNDYNRDGVRNSEPGLGGWQIRLSGPVSAVATTNASGSYCFSGLKPGTYTVCEVTQPGWVCTTPAGACATVVLGSGQNATVDFGNHACTVTTECATPPRCTAGWWPFNECTGILAKDVAGANHVTLAGSAGWTAGHPFCALQCPANDPAAFAADASPNVLLAFGRRSFGADSWIQLLPADAGRRAIVEHRAVVGGAGGRQGFLLYTEAGRLGLEVADNGVAPGYDDYLSTTAPLGDGVWHHVAATVCRDSSDTLNVTTNVVTLYIDAVNVGQWTGAAVRHGSVTVTAPLRFGQQNAGFTPQLPFAGAIDEVELYNCCVDKVAIQAIVSANQRGKCTQMCNVPLMTTIGPFSSVVAAQLTIRNFGGAPRTYLWTVSGLPAGGGCTIAGPTTFSPSAGSVTVPAMGQVSIPVVITAPPGLTGSAIACYQFDAINTTTGECLSCTGSLRRGTLTVLNSGAVTPSLWGGTTPVVIGVTNPGRSAVDVQLQVGERASADAGGAVLRLNGLPPGVPWEETRTIAPGESTSVKVDVEAIAFEPTVVHALELRIAPPGALPELLGEAGVVSAEGTDEPLAVPPPPNSPPVAALALAARPNPFRTGLLLQLALPRAGEARLDVLDVGGRRVRALFAGRLAAGITNLAWDGRDDAGRRVASGLYFVRVRQGGSESGVKVLRLE